MLESATNRVKRDSRGRYYVYSGLPYFLVFSPEGNALQRIGRRGGGPGEFRAVTGIMIDPADSLFVFDARHGRITVFSPDYAVVRVVNLDYPISGKGFFIGTKMLINQGIRTPHRAGYPLHLMDRNGEILRSFGSSADGLYRSDMREVINVRAITAATLTCPHRLVHVHC